MSKKISFDLSYQLKYGERPCEKKSDSISDVVEPAALDEQQAPLFNAKTVSEEVHRNIMETSAIMNQNKEVYQVIRDMGPITHNEIHRLTGIPVHTVSARCNDLIHHNLVEPLLDAYNRPVTKKDEVTHKQNSLWRVKKF